MANKNKRTKARREKETKEAQRKKVVEKPIYKRPWIWIALAALVIGIVVPSAYQHNQQVQEERVAAAAEAKAKSEAEPLIWESVLTPLTDIGVTESAITDKSFDVRSTADNDQYDYAQVAITTDVRTILATAMYEGSDGTWTCTQLMNEDGSHIYWTYFNQGANNATQAAVMGEDGSITMQPLYDYHTDEQVTEPLTGPAVSGADAGTTGAAAETTGATAETSGAAVEEQGADGNATAE
jgi:hypothetical protein